VPLTAEVVAILKKHRKKESGSALVFPSPQKKESLASPAYLHDRCKYVADLAGLNKEEWHLHRFRDTAATRWLRAGIDAHGPGMARA